MTQTLIDLILFDMIPKIRRGADGEKVMLSQEDFQNIMRVLSVSVSIETLIEQAAELIKKTYDRDPMRKTIEPPHDPNADFESVKLYAGDLHAEPKKSQ